MTLSKDQTIFKTADLQLKVGQTIDYKPPIGNKLSMGIILQFKYAGFQQTDTDSCWMKVKDVQGQGEETTEWISVNTWIAQYNKGIFKTKTKKQHESIKPYDDSKLPF